MKRCIKKVLSLMLSLILILVQLSININVRSVKADENYNESKLKILEIEPGNQYILNQNSFSNDVDITQMPMTEFIGKIDKVNGLYDIVYIGNRTYTDQYGQNIKYSAIGDKAPKTGVDSTGVANRNEDSHGYVEYYSENDITNKKAKELAEFIESGQLLLIDQSIFKDSSLKNSKLYNNLSKYQVKDNFKTVDNLNSDAIMKYYKSTTYKRPNITIKSYPKPYAGNLANYNSDRNMNFVFDINGDTSHTFTTRLYCDMNGDGLFKDYENYAAINKQSVGTNLQISYMVPDNFAGLMPWKLEVTDDATNAKRYEYGYTLYKSNNIAPIRVLQIYPDNKNILDLTSGLTGVSLQQQGFYNIQIDKESCSDFNQNSNSIGLNGKYDMLIIGFADSYGKVSFNEQATNSIIDFMKTGQSVMLTHDTLSTYLNNYNFGYEFDAKLRDYIGQSRYKDANNPSEKNYDGSAITHDDYPDQYNPSYGFTKDRLSVANNWSNIGYYDPTTNNGHTVVEHRGATKVNDGVFSQYPYVLSDNLNISKTHNQYYQLNLEDEDVVPWYDLCTAPYGNENDPRNYYYTYSKGNITYSGTGHSSPGDSQDEKEMFINTIVKAARTANHAPTVNVFNLNDGQFVSKNQDYLNFNFTAQDSDQNDEKPNALRRKIYINGSPIDENGDIVSDYKTMTSGDVVNVSIPKNKLKALAGANSTVTVKIEVLDTQNAKGEKIITFNYVDEPSLSANASGLKDGYLVGDTAQTSLSVNAVNSSSAIQDTMILNNSNPEALNGDGLSLNCINTSNNAAANNILNQPVDLSLKDINFTPQVDNKNTPKNFTFKFDSVGSYKVQNLFKYNFLKLDNKVQRNYEYDYNLNVKEGDVYIKCVDSSGRVFTPSVGINIIRPDGSVESKNTDSAGGAEFLKEPSGSYKVSVQNNTGYTLVDSNTQNIDLSYDNPKQTITLHFETLVAPSIEVTPSANENGWNNTDINFNLISPPNFLNNLQKMQYKIDDGPWLDYTLPVDIKDDGQHKIKARTVDIVSLCNSSESEKDVQIDNIKPAEPTIVSKNGDFCMGDVSITFGSDNENGSGIDTMEYSLDGVTWLKSDSTSKDVDGIKNNCTVYARERDKAGNYSDTASFQVNLIDNSDIELEGLTFNTIPEGGHVDFNVKVRIGMNKDGTPKYAVPSDNLTVTVTTGDGNIITINKNNSKLSGVNNNLSGVITGDGGDTVTAFGMNGEAGKSTNIVVTLEKMENGKTVLTDISLTKTVKVIGNESGLLY